MKNNKDCKIVQDLLPNYVEKLTNDETNKFIEEHLKDCDECRSIYANMTIDIEKNKEKKNEKKAVKYFKKYKNNIRILVTIILIIFLIFTGNVARKMIIISKLSDRAEKTINTSNYHRTSYSFEKDNYRKAEFFKLNDKIKWINTIVDKNGIETRTMYANKLKRDEHGNEYYNINIYTEKENEKTVKLNKKLEISVDPQNELETESIMEKLMFAIFSSISSTTYNGTECFYINNNQNENISFTHFIGKGVYINKETGMKEASIGYEINSDDELRRWPAGEYEFEFNTVTEENFIEPDINEYKVIE